MAITQIFRDVEKDYHNTIGEKILLNDIHYTSVKANKTFEEEFFIKRTGKTISLISSCTCKNLEGELFKGMICKQCGSKCESILEKKYNPVWLRSLHDDVPFVLPVYWLLLEKVINTSKVDYNVMRYVTHSRYKPGSDNSLEKLEKNPFVIRILEVTGGKRSYVDFIHNLEEILKSLILEPTNNDRKRDDLIRLLKMFQEHKDLILVRYLPMLPKNMFILEQTKNKKSTDLKASYGINVAVNWVIMANEIENGKNVPISRISNTTAKTVADLCELYSNYLKFNMLQKQGLFRKHLFGTRPSGTFRSVITPITGKHDYDGIKIPWVVALNLFQLDIINKLINKYHMSYLKTRKLLTGSLYKYSKILDDVLQELMSEAKDGKIHVLTQRNPSLFKGSILLTYISEIKKDPRLLTTSISPLICKFMNADFDGDNDNFMRVFDNEFLELLEPLRPYYSTPSIIQPATINNFLTLLPPANLILMQWLQFKEKGEKDRLVKKLKALHKILD